jgi:four helix bundle protein
MRPFRKLEVWRRSHALTCQVFRDPVVRGDFRSRALADQIWRSAGSIGANIAEGSGSGTQAQFARYLGLAIASASELENHLQLARDVGLLPKEVAEARIEELGVIGRMLGALRNRVRSAAQRAGQQPVASG